MLALLFGKVMMNLVQCWWISLKYYLFLGCLVFITSAVYIDCLIESCGYSVYRLSFWVLWVQCVWIVLLGLIGTVCMDCLIGSCGTPGRFMFSSPMVFEVTNWGVLNSLEITGARSCLKMHSSVGVSANRKLLSVLEKIEENISHLHITAFGSSHMLSNYLFLSRFLFHWRCF